MASATHPSAPEHPLTADLGWLLSKAAFSLSTEIARAFVDVGISPRHHHVLLAASCGGSTQSALADVVGLDKTTLVTTLDELEALGLAERRPSPTDRRARIITVTDAGREKIEDGRVVVERVQADVLRELPAAERTVFLEALNDLVDRRLSEPMACDMAVRRPRVTHVTNI